MAKRGPGKELNHDNWDDEDAAEEAGTFKRASSEVMQKRQIKVAHRKNPTGASSTTDSGGAFKGFSFGVKPSDSKEKLFSFGPGSNPPSLFGPASTSAAQLPATSNKSSFNFTSTSTGLASSAAVAQASSPKDKEVEGNDDSDNGTEETESDANAEYSANLRSLNEELLGWITKHVTKNPYCILTPVFKDYNRFVEELDDERKAKTKSSATQSKHNGSDKSSSGLLLGTVSTKPAPLLSTSLSTAGSGFTFGATTTTTASAPFSFGSSATVSQSAVPVSTTANTSPFKGITFGSTATGENTGFKFGAFSSGVSTAPGFTFGLSSSSALTSKSFNASTTSTTSTTTAPSLFTAGFFSSNSSTSTTTAPFSFSSGSSGFPSFGGFGQTSRIVLGGATNSSGTTDGGGDAGASQGNGEADDDAEYVPPKPESSEIKEEGSFYTVRCKLFYKKNSAWKDKGVGNLHLKKCGDNDSKTQLILRADNTLGTILLNIILPKDMPVKRFNPTNISIMCIPNPPMDDDKDEKGGMMLLFKVKGEAEADQLFQHLNDNIPK